MMDESEETSTSTFVRFRLQSRNGKGIIETKEPDGEEAGDTNMNRTKTVGRKMLFAFLLLLFVFLLAVSCGTADPESGQSLSGEESGSLVSYIPDNGSEDLSETESGASEETDAPVQEEPPVVSKLAVEKFMTPIGQNSWKRPEGWDDPESENAAKFVVIHFTSDIGSLPDDPFNLDRVMRLYYDYGASVHYVIDREGTVFCLVPENRTAWHAGKGSWKDDPKYKDRMSDYSIGIELLAIGSENDMSIYMPKSVYETVQDEWIGYTEAQYASLNALLDDICSRYGIPKDRDHVIGHEEYAPDRKRDPGELFDWGKIVPEK